MQTNLLSFLCFFVLIQKRFIIFELLLLFRRYETLLGIKPSYENEASSSITGEDKTPSNRDQPIVSTKEKRNPEVEFLKLFRNMNRKQRLRNVADGIVRALILGKPWAAAY